MGKIVRKPFRDCTWNLLFEILMRNIYVLEVLNLAPGGLLSILKFDMGAYSKGGEYSRGGSLLKRFYFTWWLIRNDMFFAYYNHFRVGNIH